jgi:hypothetical protein
MCCGKISLSGGGQSRSATNESAGRAWMVLVLKGGHITVGHVSIAPQAINILR